MKRRYIIFAIAAIAAVSCSKELISEPENDLLTVKAIISDSILEETKTDYVFANDNPQDGDEATFQWKGTEQFTRFNIDGGSIRRATYQGDAGDGATEIMFTQTSTEAGTQTDYAFYPIWKASNNAGFDYWSTPVFFKLFEELSYTDQTPLSNVVPMIGKIVDDKFIFKVATGIIAVRIQGIPSEATKLTLSTSEKNLSGGFRYSSGTGSISDKTSELGNIYNYGLQIDSPYTGNVNKTKSYTFSSLNPNKEYVFYFPIPIGTITGGLKISLYKGTTALYTINTPNDIPSIRGQITRLPFINLPLPASASIGGSINERTATISYNGATKIVYGIATSPTVGLSSLETTELSSPNTSINLNQSSTGTYYLVYQSYKGSAKIGAEKRARFLYVSNNISDINGTYRINSLSNDTYTINIESITPANDKNIKISLFNTTNSTYSAYNGASGACLGFFDYTTGVMTFDCGQSLTKNDIPYYVVCKDGAINSTDSFESPESFNLTISDHEQNGVAGMLLRSNYSFCITPNRTEENNTYYYLSAGLHWSNNYAWFFKANQ